MSQKKNLSVIALQLNNHDVYQKNLDKLLNCLSKNQERCLIIAPEVCLSDYDYDNLEKAALFGTEALEKLLALVDQQIFVFTLLVKTGDGYSNDAVVIHKHEIVHRQSKHKLFLLGNEQKYLKAGKESDIVKFETDGVWYGLLICFELRFKSLWKALEGVSIVLVPSQWGMARKMHLETLSAALAIMNQCYVVVSNSSKASMASSSGIYSPSGGVIKDDMLEEIRGDIDFSLIKMMRRYIVMD